MGGGKGFGKGKKSSPSYVEQIDFLIGSNPIEGWLQAWKNTTKLGLDFLKYSPPNTVTATSIIIPDVNFYFLVAVTAEINNVGVFNDYGNIGTGIGSASVSAGGSGYAVNDTFEVTSGGAGATGHVTAVGGSGNVTGFVIDSPGQGYTAPSNEATTALTGVGTGFIVHITGIGFGYNDTSEYALFNVVQHGPDLVDASYAKYFPYLYKWAPSDGAKIYLPANGFANISQIPNFNGNYHIYYAAKSASNRYQIPLNQLCLTFESELGNGPEYSGFTAQQIIYPPYAGAGSRSFDLGSSGTIPLVKPEIKGSFARFPPRGDADFCDMIEDTIKSGILQTGAQLGLIQRGVNLNDNIGAVQKMQAGGLLDPDADPANNWIGFQQPIKKGQVMCAFARWRWGAGSGGGTPSISDDAVSTWIPVATAPDNVGSFGFWYAIAAADIAAGNVVHIPWNGSGGFAFDMRGYAWVMDPASDTVNNTNTASGTGASAACSITVTEPCWIAAVFTKSLVDAISVPTHWNNLFPTLDVGGGTAAIVAFRFVSVAGTYTFKIGSMLSQSWEIAMLAITNSQPSPYPKALGSVLDLDSLNVVRKQCQANGLWGSVTMNAQKAASDWLKDFYTCADADPVWSGFRLKSIARSEVSAVGNGVVFASPTAAGPVATLTESDLVGGKDSPLVTITRIAPVDRNNVKQIQFFDRNSDYAPSVVSEPMSGPIAITGPRKEDPINLPEIQDPLVARKVLAVEVRRAALLPDVYSFTALPRWAGLETRDLILINDKTIGLNNFAVRLTKVEEQDDHSLACEAEPFVYGCHAPDISVVTAASPYVPGLNADPGSVNAPVIFEAVPRLSAQNPQEQIIVAVSATSPDYGGCAVLISTDGGSSYKAIGSILGSATMGVTVGDWPAATDPDTTNDLNVDLTESLGTLDSYMATDRDNFVYPCYVSGGSACIPYELMTYNLATLTGTNQYKLSATGAGNELRRAVFGAPAPAGAGVDHPSGSKFVFLSPAGVGIFRINMDPSWIGKTLYFKFPTFNQFGQSQQQESDAVAYSFSPTGCPGATQNPNNNNYKITGGALAQPTAASVTMAQTTATFPSNPANYNARTFTIPTPTAPTTYYVTVLDPGQIGDTGTGTTLTAQCQTSNALVGAPGYVYIGSITAIPAGGAAGGGNGGAPISSGIPMVIGFPIATGATGTNVAAEAVAPRGGTLSVGVIVIKASDATTDLTFDIQKKTGSGAWASVLSAPQTVTHGAAADSIITFSLASASINVARHDQFIINISSGTSAWKFTVQLET